MKNPARKEWRELIRLAIPLAAAQAGTQLMGVVDTAVVGRLGARQLGAVGLGNALFFTICIVGMGIVMGIDPMTAQAFGGGNGPGARRIMWQGIWLGILVSAILSIPMAMSPLLLGAMHIEAGVASDARIYLLLRILGVSPLLLYLVLRSYLQAQGLTRPMVIAMVVANGANLLLDIALVFGGGWLPPWTGVLRSIPALGVAGSAIATVLSALLQLVILAAAVKQIPVRMTGSFRRLHRKELAQAFRIGMPLGLQMGAEVGIFALVGLLAGTLGKAELAAHQLALTLAAFSFTGAVGIGAAGSVRVGRAIGAGDVTGTRLAGMVAFGGGAAFMSLSALTFLVIPGPLARLLTNQQSVIAAAIPLLAVAAVFQISDGIQAVGAGVLRGAADTRFAFVANLLGHWLVGLPVAWILGFWANMGIVGLWWGLCAGLTAVAVLLFARFLRLSARAVRPVVT